MKDDNTVEAEIVEDTKTVLSEIKYQVSSGSLKEILEIYRDVPEIDPSGDVDDVAEKFKFVLKGHKHLVKVRTGIEKTRKHLKSPAMEYGKLVDGIAKEFQAMIKPLEDKLFIQRKVVEDYEAKLIRDDEEAEELRIDTIKTKILNIKNLPLQHFNSSVGDITIALESLTTILLEEYEEFYDEAVENQNFVIAQLQTARSNKLLVENAQKIQDEADEKARIEKEIEDAKFAKEKADFEADKALFEKDKKEKQESLDAQQEDINSQLAEKEADELMEKQQKELSDKILKEQEDNDNLYHDTLEKFEAYDDAKSLLDSIIDGVEFPHIKWEV